MQGPDSPSGHNYFPDLTRLKNGRYFAVTHSAKGSFILQVLARLNLPLVWLGKGLLSWIFAPGLPLSGDKSNFQPDQCGRVLISL